VAGSRRSAGCSAAVVGAERLVTPPFPETAALPDSLTRVADREPTVRSIFRVVAIVVASVLALYLIYLLRTPLSWIGMALFVALALAGPVARLERHMPRGLAIACVYLAVLSAPVALGALVLPDLVTQGTDLAQDVPRYATEVRDFIERNETLRDLDEKYDIASQLESQAETIPDRIGDAATLLSDLGLGVLNSIFALFNVMILSIFMLASGGRWVHAALSLRPPHQRERLERVFARVAAAVSGYVQGALAIAAIAGTSSFIVMTILGVPFAAPLAVIVGLFALIPVVGATIAAVLVAGVTLFENFPTATILWVIWAIGYQQIENYVIQPQVQKRAVDIQPFVVLVAVLFGATLLGVVGAIVAIPVAASIQIGVREWWDWRVSMQSESPPSDPEFADAAGAVSPALPEGGGVDPDDADGTADSDGDDDDPGDPGSGPPRS
jgi:predicted PurR-regulated permease PerM